MNTNSFETNVHVEFEAEVYADHVMDGWTDSANDSYEPNLANAFAYFDAIVPLEMVQPEPIHHQPSFHSYDTVVIAAPDDDEEVSEARAHFEKMAKAVIEEHYAA